MSNDPNKPLETIVVQEEDFTNVENFYKHFNISMPSSLSEEIANFRKNPSSYSLDQQQKFKEELCRAICSSDHELLTDDLFKVVVDNCKDVWFNAQFDRDIEETFSDEDKKENK